MPFVKFLQQVFQGTGVRSGAFWTREFFHTMVRQGSDAVLAGWKARLVSDYPLPIT